jgi:phospholipid/cholesterol/gamma-HCH transport system substrate-binding protein
VAERFADRIRGDTVATIAGEGLLGDKLVELSIGSAEAPEVPAGGWLRAADPVDANQLLATLGVAAEHARAILARVDRATEGLSASATLADAQATFAALRRVSERMEHGPGPLHDAVFGGPLADETLRSVRSLGQAADRAGVAATQVSRVLGVIRTETPVEDLLINWARLGRRGAAMVENMDTQALRRATDDLQAILGDIRAGRGSLGGLIEDPTLYEATKKLLVDVERNRVLKSLARLVIRRRDAEEVLDGRPAEVEVHPRPAPGAPGPGLKASQPPSPRQ